MERFPTKSPGAQILKRIALFLFLCAGIALADNFDKDRLTGECMDMLNDFGIADTFFTLKTCNDIVAEIEDELHYGDSIFPFIQYTKCMGQMVDYGSTDTVKFQKVCTKVAEQMVIDRDSDEKKYKEKLMDLCLMLKPSFGASDDSAHYWKVCDRSTDRSLRHQKARPHRQ